MKRRNPEQALHRSVAYYLSCALTPASFFSTIGHGGGGSLRGAILHGLGMKAGVPDMLIVHDGRAYFLELKSASGRLSPAQTETTAALARAGAHTWLVRDLDDVRAGLAFWGIPSRDVLAQIRRAA